MNEGNENVLSAEKEETFLCYLNSHVTVHEEKKNYCVLKKGNHTYYLTNKVK